jgi:heptosyltransferase-2
LEYRLIARMIGAPIRASHEYEGHSWLDRRCVTFSVPQDYTVHSVTNNCRLLGAIGRTPVLPDAPYELNLSDAEQDFARRFMAQHQLIDGAVMGVHVGSGGTKNLRYKRWPLPRWLEFLALFRRAHPTYPILFFGGPEEVEAHREIQARFPNAGFHFPSTKNMRQAGALIQKCRVFLSVDTALMHVAAAVRPQRQVVIEAPTLNPTNTPWQARWEIVPNPKLNGRSLDYYRYDGGPIRGTPSELEALMSSVTPEAVLQVVDRAL